MRLSEIMTACVVTAGAEATVRMTEDVIEGALPRFYFHEKG